KGVKVCKFWAAPRGLDKWDQMWIDSPIRLRSMKLARELGMTLMVHVADPDTWFATKYADGSKYGTKRDHYARFEHMLAMFPDTDWWAAHMAGSPEDLDFLQGLLDRWPRLRVDTSATKWMVRELSKHADVLRDFLARNPGRVMFGTDIVADPANLSFDLFASRFWALRTLLETDFDGPSPIVDPDLSLVDPSLPTESTAHLRGASVGPATLADVYVGACRGLLG
ncbi:MAG: amidohydrolase family protein, partial [Phycisphaeraceae bacterium]|nr:amidohydrolase family protein [Phycisphaeraceae bacterium]